MRFWTFFLIVYLLTIVLYGCSDDFVEGATRNFNNEAETTGNPYRWITKEIPEGVAIQKVLIGTPGKTAADEQLQKYILTKIGSEEVKFGGMLNPTILETRSVSQLPDEITEIWMISRGVKRIAYTVKMKPSQKTGTDLLVFGPWE